MNGDWYWLINNLSLTRVIILCSLLFLNMASSCFHYGSSSSSLFLDNASWLHQDLFDPFFWGLAWLYLYFSRTQEQLKSAAIWNGSPYQPSFQWHHIEVIISHPVTSQANKKIVHHALWAIGITERNVQSLSIFGSRLLQDCLASGSPKLLLRQATCGRVPGEQMNDRCKPSKILETPVLMTRFSSRLKSPRPGSMQLATHLHHPFHAVFCGRRRHGDQSRLQHLGPQIFGGKTRKTRRIFWSNCPQNPNVTFFALFCWYLLDGTDFRTFGWYVYCGFLEIRLRTNHKSRLQLILPYPVIPKLSRMLLNSIRMCPGHSIMTLQLESEW